MVWAASAVVAGAAINAIASNSAAGKQADSAANAQRIAQDQYAQTRADLLPYNQLGQAAGGQLSQLLGIGGDNGSGGYGSLNAPMTAQNFQDLSPAYQFQQQQGMSALNNSLAAKDGVMSGAATKGMIGFNQGMANTAWDNAFNQYQTQNTNTYNRLAGLLGIGQNAAAQTGNNGAQMANTAAGAATAQGQALASGTMGVSNAINGGMSNGLGYYMANNMMGGKLFGGVGSGGGGSGVVSGGDGISPGNGGASGLYGLTG